MRYIKVDDKVLDMRCNKKIQWMLLLGLIMAGQASLSGCSHKQTKDSMSNIEYIPKEFREIDTNFNEEKNSCSPCFNCDRYQINILEINTPEQITINKLDIINDKLIFPICIFSSISDLRALKYEDDKMQIFIRERNNCNTTKTLSGFIAKKDISPDDISLPSWQDKIEQRHKEEVEEAIKLTDEQLDDSPYSPQYLNINLMDYIDFSIKSGKYEVWLSFCGLESNHTMVEIVQRSNVK